MHAPPVAIVGNEKGVTSLKRERDQSIAEVLRISSLLDEGAYIALAGKNAELRERCNSVPVALMFQQITENEPGDGGKPTMNKRVTLMHNKSAGTQEMFHGTSAIKVPGRERAFKTTHDSLVPLYAGAGESKQTCDKKLGCIENEFVMWHVRGQRRLYRGEEIYLASKRSKREPDENGQRPIPPYGSAPIIVNQSLPYPYPSDKKPSKSFRQHINKEVIHAGGGKQERAPSGKFTKQQPQQ